MFNLKHLITGATVSALFFVPTIASANDRDLRATTIPASACRPSSDTDDAKVRLTAAGYLFNGNSTGTVTFHCPLPINANTVSDATNDNDITTYRVYYRDSDGNQNSAQITVQLGYVGADGGALAVAPAWSSNLININGNTAQVADIPDHDVGSNRFYGFVVTMRRNSPNNTTVFTGIDFP